LPEYRKVGVSGPDHRRLWVYDVIWDDEEVARGEGVSKREAQHQAARRALVRLGLVPDE
jgi:ribonuclease-3